MNDAASLSPVAPQVRAYDMGAWLYDFIVGSRPYHHLAWGMAPSRHAEFAEHALGVTGAGPILDAGCGSLLFTGRLRNP
jgi:hypothetical protein